MLTIKILFTINPLPLKKLFRQNAIYNSFRVKKYFFDKKKFI